jgi:uncharacterized protein
MTEQPINWKPLERGQLKAMYVGAVLEAIFLLLIITPIDLGLHFWGAEIGIAPPIGILLGPVALILLYTTIIAPGRRFKRWGYAHTTEELHVASGIWTHTQTSVAFHRVQHIDVSQGPIARMFGVCRLVLNTAGTMHSRIALPGLTRETAEALRDEIRAQIRQEVA